MTENEAIEALRLINTSRVHPFYSWEEMAEVRDIAISALKEIQQYREIGTVEECREAREKQNPKKPIWKQEIGIVHKDYADGHGETVEEKWADWVCPNCGWFVGEQYIPRRHNQRKSNHCSRCGQKINWNENLEGIE